MGVEFIGGLIVSTLFGTAAASFTIGATGITLATVAGYAVVAAAAVGLAIYNQQTAAGGGPPPTITPEAGHLALKQARAPRVVGYGRNRLAGVYALFEATGEDSYDVQALHHGRVGAFVGYYLHDDVVEIDSGGIVQAMSDGRYGDDRIDIQRRLGAATETAYSQPISALGSPIWTSAHRGDGIASAAVTCLGTGDPSTHQNIYPKGKPELSVIADCAPIFDPRDDDQDRDDESTWLVSSNPMLQIIDQLWHPDRGMGLDWDTLIEPVLDELMAEADLCDVLVARKDGSSEPRYKSDGQFTLDGDPADPIKAINDACDGWIADNGDGSMALKVGVYRSPAFQIPADQIKYWTLDKGVPDEEVVNELAVEYTSPLHDYKTVQAEPWRDEASIDELGRVRSQRLTLPYVHSHAQARRLAKRKAAQLNAPLRGTLTVSLYGLIGLGERWIRIEDSDDLIDDLRGLIFENKGATIDLQNQTMTFRFVSVNPNAIDAWDPDDEEGTAPVVPVKVVYPGPPLPTNLDATLINSTPSLNVVWVEIDHPNRADLTYQARYRIDGSADPYTETASTFTISHAVSPTRVVVQITLPGLAADEWEIGLRSYAPGGGSPSAYSTSTTFIVPSPTWQVAVTPALRYMLSHSSFQNLPSVAQAVPAVSPSPVVSLPPSSTCRVMLEGITSMKSARNVSNSPSLARISALSGLCAPDAETPSVT